MITTRSTRFWRTGRSVVSLVVLALALAACGGAGLSGSLAQQSASISVSQAPSVAPLPTATPSPTSTPEVTARCAPTSGTHATETANWSFRVKPRYNIKVGQAVAFTPQLDNVGGTTVTEGTNNTAAADACVDRPVAGGSSLTVTFYQPGDYFIFCKISSLMKTVIHVE